MATYRQRENGVYAEVYVQGYRKGKTFRTKTAARNWAERIEESIKNGVLKPTRDGLHAAIDQYIERVASKQKGAKWACNRLRKFKEELPDIQLTDMSRTMFADFRDKRLDEVSTSTVRREMNILSGMFYVFLTDWQWIDHNPMTGIRKPSDKPHRETLITQSQRDAIYEHVGYMPGSECYSVRHYVAAALELAVNTAMRLGEISNLEWSDIDFDSRVIRLRDTKNGLPREVPINNAARTVLMGLRNTERPFMRRKNSISCEFREIKYELGFNDIRFHDSRATAITNFASKVNINTLARISGHKDLSMLQRYYRRSMSDIAGDLD